MFFKVGTSESKSMIVYFDDIIITSNDTNETAISKKRAKEELKIKELGDLKFFLGIVVSRSRKGIIICNSKYIIELLKESGKLECKLISTLLPRNGTVVHLRKIHQ